MEGVPSDHGRDFKRSFRSRGNDLFVFNDSERFFVEVTDTDQLHAKQLVTFPLIEEVLACDVRVARLTPVPGAQASHSILNAGQSTVRPI